MGLFKKPRTPKPTAQDIELESQQRKQINELTRESNQRLKRIKHGRVGRATLLGGGERGIVPGISAGGVRGGPGTASRPGRRGGGSGGSRGGGGPARRGIFSGGSRR